MINKYTVYGIQHATMVNNTIIHLKIVSHRRKFIDASELGQFILEISKILGAWKIGSPVILEPSLFMNIEK